MHTADIHFDSPFATLAGKGKFAQERRLEQRKVMKEMVEYIKENNIPYFFIAGDLYEQDYIKKSTVEYVNQLFTEIPNTKIFITPGNHDPYIKNLASSLSLFILASITLSSPRRLYNLSSNAFTSFDIFI